ncbi:acyltransferase [bacterium]|nr:acyltransferase [bacterium]
MDYRKDIDGLRALAVLGVIAYHSEILIGDKFLLSGGFLGVDIFFVISGYLITSIIYRESIINKNFSLLNFYERRARRLLPALLTVLFFTLFFAYHLLLPVQFVEYLKTVISSMFFYSNFYFHYTGQAYGQAILSTKPLLHTWSLSVEEQFYLLYPILFIFFFRIFKSNIKYLLYLGFLISIIFASIISEKHASFNFYMIISRSWELIFGGLIALKHLTSKEKLKDNKILPSLGFFLIIFSFYFFNDPHKHPSYFTLLPIIGSYLIINNNNEKNIISKILSNNFMTNIGLISYSLYLWHHPFLSFGKISGLTENNLLMKILLILIAFIFSGLTYFFVEKNFRNKKIIPTKNLFKILFPTSIFFLVVMFFLPLKQQNQYPSILNELYSQTWFETKQFIKPCFQRKRFYCNFGKTDSDQTVFLIGDSVMASMQEELRKNLLKRNINFIPMTNAGCDFLNKSFDKTKNIFCNTKVQLQRKKKIKEFDKSILILHLNYTNINKDYFEEHIDEFLDNIKEYLNSGHIVILLYPIPQWRENVSIYLHKKYKQDKNLFLSEIKDPKNYIYINYKNFLKDTKKISKKFNQLEHKNLYKLFSHNIFCNNILNDRCLAHSSKEIFVVDGSHLSRKGSILLNNDLIKIIDKIYTK